MTPVELDLLEEAKQAKLADSCRDVAAFVTAMGGSDLRGLSNAELVARVGVAVDQMQRCASLFGVSPEQAGNSLKYVVEQMRPGSN